MNNLMDSVKRFFKNKNTVTILGVIVILVLLYVGYSTQINSAVNPISIPVASRNIQPRKLITDDMITMIDVPIISVSDNVIRNKSLIVGKYSNINTMIPSGSMFFKETVIDAKDLPDAAFVELEKDQIAYSFPVNMVSTYGNSIMPGNNIDIYMKVGDGNDEKVMIGKLLNNIKVLAVKDSSGRAVFENTDETRTPSMMIFGLKEKMWLLLSKASYLGNQGVELFPVPHSGKVKSDGATEVSTKQLEDYINAHAVDIPTSSDVDDLTPVATETGGNPNTVTLTFPEECGTTYVCKYKKDNGNEVTVKKTKVNIPYTAAGTLIATVTESDGTVHTLNTSVPLTTNSENGALAG